MKNRSLAKSISILLVLTFITGQVHAGQISSRIPNNKSTLAPSLPSDPTINPVRSDAVRESTAGILLPDTIGYGKPLQNLLEGRLPAAFRDSEFEGAVRHAIVSAAVLAMAARDNSAFKSEYRDILNETISKLIGLRDGISKLHLYNAVVTPPADYLLGFNHDRKIGLAVELLEELPPNRLSQLLFRLSIPQGTITSDIAASDDREAVYRNIRENLLIPVFGKGEVEGLDNNLRVFLRKNGIRVKISNASSAAIPRLSSSGNITVPTLKFPGTPDLIEGSAEYEELVTRINSNVDRSLRREELSHIRNIIQSKAPPTFFTTHEVGDMHNVVNALTGQISLKDLNLVMKGPFYKGKILHNIVVNLIKSEDNTFRTSVDNFYQEVVTYNDGVLYINLPRRAFNDCYLKNDTNAITQTVLHPLLETILGLSHQEAALALSFYNSDATIVPGERVAISDAHRYIIEQAKKRAINGDAAATRQLRAILSSDYRFELTGSDIQALRARGRSIESVDLIRIHSEELARIINGMVRGPIGKFDTKIELESIETTNFLSGSLAPTQKMLDEYSLVVNATVAAAVAVVVDGYVGKVSDLTEKAEVRIIKDSPGADGLAKREIQVVFQLSGYRIIVTVSEGGLRDEVEEAFMGGDTVGKKGLEVISIAMDVVENTNAAASGGPNATSIAVSAKGEHTLLENAPDVYASLIVAHVPKEKIAEFEREPLEPGPFEGEENIDAVRQQITRQLTRIAEANNITLGDMEVVAMNRSRESVRNSVFKELVEREGLKLTLLEDGTFNHALEAALGRKEGKLKVFLGTSGAPEAFQNVSDAKIFHIEGAVASARILSNFGLKKANDLSPANAYKFSETEHQLITELRPDDHEKILSGDRLFTTADVKGEPDGAVTFITDNEVFGLPGVKLIDDNTYVVTTLRTREKGGKAYCWVEKRKVTIAPSEVKVEPYNSANGVSRESTSGELVDHVIVENDETRMGETAARRILDDMERALKANFAMEKVVMLWASAPSQHSTWKALLKMVEQDIAEGKLKREDMKRLVMFHMDEYLGLKKGAKQRFGTVLKKELFDKLKKFGLEENNIYYIDAEAENPELEAIGISYTFASLGGRFNIVVGGIGEDSHVAFNSAPDARFDDGVAVKVVKLNEESRQQQVHDGELKKLEDVPTHAITFTLPPIFAADKIHIIIPRASKAEAVRNTLDSEKITPDIPATGLKQPDVLPKVTFYLDNDSASRSSVARRVIQRNEKSARASTSGVKSDLPLRAAEFRTYLVNALDEAKAAGKNVVLAIDTDIGSSQRKQIMPLFRVIDKLKELKDAKGNLVFPNLIAIRNNGQALAKEIVDMRDKDTVELNRVFVVARKDNLEKNVFDGIKGEGKAWLAAIDDSGEGVYLPVYESAALMMMASLNADTYAVRELYSRISENPPELLEDMLRMRIIYILPKITRFSPAELRQLYEAAQAAYIAA